MYRVRISQTQVFCKRRCIIKRLILAVVLSFCFATSVFAQAKADTAKGTLPPPPPGPQGQQQIMVKTIFAYEKELGLTEAQVKNLKDILTKFQDYVNEKRKDIVQLRTELNDLIVKRADLKLIRSALEQISRLQVETSYNDVETARKVEGVLTAAQLTKWKEIQGEARKQAEEAMKKAQEQAKAK